jgi:hypothetical protein
MAVFLFFSFLISVFIVTKNETDPLRQKFLFTFGLSALIYLILIPLEMNFRGITSVVVGADGYFLTPLQQKIIIVQAILGFVCFAVGLKFSGYRSVNYANSRTTLPILGINAILVLLALAIFFHKDLRASIVFVGFGISDSDCSASKLYTY